MTPAASDPCLGPGEIPPRGLGDVFLMLPARIGGLDLVGCVAARAFPDGRLAVIEPLMFGIARLCVKRPEVMAEDGPLGSWDDEWHYPSGMDALLGLASWEPDETPEPTGWHRHPHSGRRRQKGDPATEEVRA